MDLIGPDPRFLIRLQCAPKSQFWVSFAIWFHIGAICCRSGGDMPCIYACPAQQLACETYVSGHTDV